MTLSDGPCLDWPVEWSCDTEVSTASPEVTGMAVDMATRILWGLSGRQYGQCPVVLRPCRQTCYDRWPSAHPLTYPWSSWGGSPSNWDASYWFASSCGTCAGSCSCGEVPQVELPARTASVSAVLVDGVLLPPTSYRLDNSRILVRTDGLRWPRCNNLRLADTQPGTWSVAVNVGTDVPASAAMPMGELACQILRARAGQDCRLPMQVQSLVRQGVTVHFPDINAALENGRTGLYLTDLWLASVNPSRLQSRARAYRVDGSQVRRPGL